MKSKNHHFIDNQCAVITGANSGLGLAFTKKCLREGLNVLAVDLFNDQIFPIQQESTYSGKILFLRGDVSVEQTFIDILETLNNHHLRGEVWLNGVGVAKASPLNFDDRHLHLKHFHINYQGVYWGTHYALKHLQMPQRGHIINVSSMNGIIPAPLLTSYSASKHAIIGLTRSLQLELEQQQKFGLHLMLVLPGFFKTPLVENQNVPLPEWIKEHLSSAEDVCEEIWQGILKHKPVLYPARGAQIMSILNHSIPFFPEISTRFLLGKTWSEKLGLKKIHLYETHR